MKWILYLLVPVFFLTSCGLQEKEQALKKKEAELNQKEQELIAREKTVELKEQELADKQMKLDTLSRDSTFLINPAIPGVWSVQMTCVQTTCTGSAIGDTRKEKWIVSYEAAHVIARVMTGNKLIRVYTGAFTDSTSIELKDETEATATEPATRMVVRLTIKDSFAMTGQREIARDNDCKIVYALQMQKQNG
jgi:hypothetical protein